MEDLTKTEREQIDEILSRRANEVASYLSNYRSNPEHYGSVEMALSREVARLRRLADRVNPKAEEDGPL